MRNQKVGPVPCSALPPRAPLVSKPRARAAAFPEPTHLSAPAPFATVLAPLAAGGELLPPCLRLEPRPTLSDCPPDTRVAGHEAQSRNLWCCELGPGGLALRPAWPPGRAHPASLARWPLPLEAGCLGPCRPASSPHVQHSGTPAAPAQCLRESDVFAPARGPPPSLGDVPPSPSGLPAQSPPMQTANSEACSSASGVMSQPGPHLLPDAWHGMPPLRQPRQSPGDRSRGP
mmetsp:Transcript_33593/g.75404  ORF Transcript_33593/g.75404 Transcript_33593/m.75404 type:complete len:231 (-) Transcript_33593:575-1267(-)